MNDSIKFTQDDPRGKYAKDDTGTLVAITRDYTNRVIGVVRLDAGAYVEAVLNHIEYAGS